MKTSEKKALKNWGKQIAAGLAPDYTEKGYRYFLFPIEGCACGRKFKVSCKDDPAAQISLGQRIEKDAGKNRLNDTTMGMKSYAQLAKPAKSFSTATFKRMLNDIDDPCRFENAEQYAGIYDLKFSEACERAGVVAP